MLYTMADEIGRTPEARGERKPLAGYLRITHDRHGNKIGYDVQKSAIQRWADYAGETIGHWYQDKDLTAADLSVRRPDYEEMLTSVKAGQWGGIATWRLDRLVRMSYEIERCLRLVEECGSFIVAIDPTVIDSRDPMGKMFMRILIMFAEMEIAAMRARQKGHQLEKARTGKYKGGGSRPFGFEGAIRDEHGKVLNSGTVGVAHHPTEAALIREASRRLLSGESCTEIVQEWLSRDPPILGPNGSPMTVTGLRKVLNGARVAGFREYQDPDTGRTELAEAEWKPIIDRSDWERIRAMAVTRTKGRPYGYLLSGGVAICGACNQRMIGSRMKSSSSPDSKLWYRCEAGPAAAHRGSCGRNLIRAEPLDEMVLSAVMARVARTPEILDAVDQDIAGSSDEAVRTARETIADCDRKLEEYAAMAALPASRGGLTHGEWSAFRAAVMQERMAALRRLETHRSVRPVPVPLGRDRQDLRRWYEGLTLSQKRAFIRAHVDSVRVARGTRGGVPKVDLGRVSITFADAKESNAGSDHPGVRDLNTDALGLAPSV